MQTRKSSTLVGSTEKSLVLCELFSNKSNLESSILSSYGKFTVEQYVTYCLIFWHSLDLYHVKFLSQVSSIVHILYQSLPTQFSTI
jgi:hypothetical protein